MARFDALFTGFNEGLEARGRRRVLRPLDRVSAGHATRGGRVLVNFSSNDYLGLASDPRLAEGAIAATRAWGVGSGASRLVCGTLALHETIEAKIARLKGTEAALLLTSGYQANTTVPAALFNRALLGGDAIVFLDALAHNSLILGCRAAGIRPIRYRHNDLHHLEELLRQQRERKGTRFILTESVFSMDGDRADVPALAALAERTGAFLYLDEAHATGILGPGGAGLASEAPGGVPLIMGTFSKALGSLGAYIACSHTLRDYLVNRCGGFVYSTALPPPVLGAIDAALDLLPGLDAERARLLTGAERVRQGFRAAGIDTGASTTQIIPAMIGGEAEALALSLALEEEGLLGVAIRPPTVPVGTSRIRFALCTAHDEADLDRLVRVMGALARPGKAACPGKIA